jgi:adenosylhomocysteine nucleosidase
MLAAALEEELEAGMALCRDRRRICGRSVRLWQAARGGTTIHFLKTGVGPKRAAASLEEALEVTKPSRILVVGYAGALDPGLKLGHLVAVGRALWFSLDEKNPDWEHVRLDGEFGLADCETLARSAKSAGLSASTGDTLTSSHVLGDPAHKRLLYEKFHASIVDMETAALASTARARAIPLSCVRVVSDEARDTFLAPFSYDPSANIPARAKKLLDTGMMQTYREWKDHASVAKGCLSRFLSHYL